MTPDNNTADALSQDKSNLNMNMHDGYAKCTQLMVSLFVNKGLMYIQNSYLSQLFLHVWLLTEVILGDALFIYLFIYKFNNSSGIEKNPTPHGNNLS